MIDEDMRAVIDGQHLCFAATVSQDGRPNLSPKGTIRVWDNDSIFFCDTSSPNTRSNLEKNPWIEVNVVDPLSRRGYRFFGKATLHRNDEIYKQATQRIFSEEKASYPVHAVVLIKVERALPVISPGYIHIKSEHEMRNMWKERRAAMESEFEKHITHSGPFKPN